jgi:peptidoglycan/LPS O-acetylase OafA/YrhL
MDTRRFAALDGLRAFAAAAVVWHHANQGATGFFNRSIGVTTFFIISGFLITRILLREREQTETIRIGRFWMRRVLRIFPLYYAVLAVYVLLVARMEHGTQSGAGFWASLPYFLTFTTNWFVDRTPGERVIFYFAWSLAVQEQFYLFWPVILRYVRKRNAIAIPLAFLLVSDLAMWTGVVPNLEGSLVYRMVASLDSPIFFGVLAAIILESERGFRLVHRVAGQPWSIPAAASLVLLPVWYPGEPRDLFGLSITYFVAACVLAPRWTTRIVATPVALHIGNVSYGIFLMHMLALNAVRRLLPDAGPMLVFALGFPLVVLVATASHRWFEQPFMRLRDIRFPQPALGQRAPLPVAMEQEPALR